MELTDRYIGKAIASELSNLANEAYLLQVEKMPELMGNLSKLDFEKQVREIESTILYLSNSISVSSPKIFVNYVEWFAEMMKSDSHAIRHFQVSIECIFQVIKNNFDEAQIPFVKHYIDQAIENLENKGIEQQVPEQNNNYLKPYRDQYVHYLLNGERHKANEIVQDLVAKKTPVEEIYMEIFHESQYEIGKLWQTNQISIAEEHYCTASTQLIMGQLYPLIFATPKNDYVFVGTCVGGELHELGVRMVSDFLELAGWNTYYLGANAPIPTIVETIVKEKADVIGISVTMTYHIEEARQLIERIRSDVRCVEVKILVGGYPFIVDDKLWQTIGADGYAINAREVVKVAEKLIVKE